MLLPFLIIAQPEHTGELRIELMNYGSSWNVTFTLTAVSARWDENYELTDEYESASDNIHSSYPSETVAYFDHVLDPGENDTFAVGLYKISAIENSAVQAYFWMDWRTSNWNSSLDVRFKYDVNNNRFRDINNTQTIDYTYQTLWDLTDNLLETSGLEDYWGNCLALINDGNNHPKLVWGPHPSFTTTHFYIYRAIEEIPVDPKNINFSLWAITNASTYELTSYDFVIEVDPTHCAFYYVKAFNSSNSTFSSATNGLSTEGQYFPYKIAIDKPNENQPLGFNLDQNYPNPFNPSTTIDYTLPENSFVTLKVYDVLGNAIATLVNDNEDAGNHSIVFDAQDLPSGIYLYKIESGNFREVRKMILLK